MEIGISEKAKFKLMCVYSHKLDGSPVTQSEKDINKHIEWYNSVDYILTSFNVLRIRHDLAYLKLIEHVYKKWVHIETCTLFMFDLENSKEIKIGFWDKSNFSNNELYEQILVRQGSNVLCVGTK